MAVGERDISRLHWLKIRPKDAHFDETAGLPGWMGGDGRKTGADEM